MVSDSITSAPIPSAANTKNLAKKKRTNRSAKLKQNKIEARREQWLSQGAVKSKGCKDGVESDGHAPPLQAGNHGKRSLEQMETRRRRGEDDDGSIHHDSDWESPSNSPTGDDSGTNFTGSSSCSSGSSSSSSTSSSNGCCSGNITEEDNDDEEEEEEEEGGGGDDDDGCLDDWEAVADALAADDMHQHQHQQQNPGPDSLPSQGDEIEAVVVKTASSSLPCEVANNNNNGSGLGPRNSKPESARLVPWGASPSNCRAWRADDAFRPQSLPNLSKQHSLPDRRCSGGVPWGRAAMPSSCPICCEDLDLTDSSFLPCLCGFRLCLFCHKRILEEDGRCPGCRKPYECEAVVETEASVLGGSLTLRLARSCSMIERS